MENNLGSSVDSGLNDAQSAAGVKDKAARSAQGLVDRAESEARSRLNAGKKDAALTLSSVASTLLSSSSQLKDEQQNVAGEYVEKAAEQIDRLAQYIQNADPGQVADEVQRFARRRPAVFIGAAFAIGVIGARFLKSSRRSVEADDRLYSPGLTDREVPTLRSVESSSAGVGSSMGASSTSGGSSASIGDTSPSVGIGGNSGTELP
ncbi:MAG TPA: hypothetical protein VEB19_02195 [Gemmatimonadaceae bacterium]|nr:hypothetical protein [Gemmatimonadaceae bacterium]